jgi:hypothetical protein
MEKITDNSANMLFEKTIKISSTFSVFSNSGHVGWMSRLPDTILKGGHQRTNQRLVSEMKIF